MPSLRHRCVGQDPRLGTQFCHKCENSRQFFDRDDIRGEEYQEPSSSGVQVKPALLVPPPYRWKSLPSSLLMRSSHRSDLLNSVGGSLQKGRAPGNARMLTTPRSLDSFDAATTDEEEEGDLPDGGEFPGFHALAGPHPASPGPAAATPAPTARTSQLAELLGLSCTITPRRQQQQGSHSPLSAGRAGPLPFPSPSAGGSFGRPSPRATPPMTAEARRATRRAVIDSSTEEDAPTAAPRSRLNHTQQRPRQVIVSSSSSSGEEEGPGRGPGRRQPAAPPVAVGTGSGAAAVPPVAAVERDGAAVAAAVGAAGRRSQRLEQLGARRAARIRSALLDDEAESEGSRHRRRQQQQPEEEDGERPCTASEEDEEEGDEETSLSGFIVDDDEEEEEDASYQGRRFRWLGRAGSTSAMLPLTHYKHLCTCTHVGSSDGGEEDEDEDDEVVVVSEDEPPSPPKWPQGNGQRGTAAGAPGRGSDLVIVVDSSPEAPPGARRQVVVRAATPSDPSPGPRSSPAAPAAPGSIIDRIMAGARRTMDSVSGPGGGHSVAGRASSWQSL